MLELYRRRRNCPRYGPYWISAAQGGSSWPSAAPHIRGGGGSSSSPCLPQPIHTHPSREPACFLLFRPAGPVPLLVSYLCRPGWPAARPPARRRFSSRPARLCLCSRPSSPVRPATNCLSLTRMFFFSRDCFCTPRSPEARQSSFPFLSPLSPLSPLDRVPAWCVCWLSSFRVSALKETHLCVCAELASS